MTNHETTLLQLLQFASRRLKSAATNDLPNWITNDPELGRRWRCIANHWELLFAADRGLSKRTAAAVAPETLATIARTTEKRDLRHAEAIAAFVEQRLPRDIEKRIEAKCWSDPAWLAEIVTAYYDVHDADAADVPMLDHTRLSHRLAVLNANPNTQAPTLAAVSTNDEGARTNSTVGLSLRLNDDEPSEDIASGAVELPLAIVMEPRPKMLAGKRSRSILTRYWPSILAASVLMLAGSLAWLLRAPQTNVAQLQETDPSTAGLEFVQQQQPLVEAITKEDAGAADESEEPRFSPILESVVERIAPELGEQSATDEQIVVDAPDWNTIFESFDAIPDPTTSLAAVDPPAPDSRATAPLSVAIEWSQTKGVLATRESADQTWQGLQAGLGDSRRFEFASLPGSWAQGDLDRAGKLTLSDNSQVRIWRMVDSEAELHLAVAKGQVALSEIPDQAMLEVFAGPAQWKVSTKVPNTSIAIDLNDIAPRLQVDVGEALVNGTLLSKGHELVWADAHSVVAEKTRERPRWIQSAPANVRNAQRSFNRGIQDRLSGSRNVVDALRDVSARADSDHVSDRVVAARMLMSFEPQQFALEMLESNDSMLGNEMLLWLFAQNPRLPPGRPIWASIVRRTQSPEKVRQLVNWIELAQQRSRVSSETALAMAQWLEDDQAFFRRSGQFFLTLAFGNRVDYDPQWPANRRAAAAQSWREKIAEHYRARQRRDAAQRSR